MNGEKRSSFKKYQFSNNEVEWFGEQDLNNKVIYIIKEQALGDIFNTVGIFL